MIDENPRGASPHTPTGEPAPSPFYIQAPSPLADEQTRVLKHGDTFAVFDHYGDLKQCDLGEEGLYHDGTRHLSCFLLLLDQHRPLFLSSTVKEDNDHLTVDLTNPDLLLGDQVAVRRGTLHIFRCKFLWGAACYERLWLRNFGMAPIEVNFSFRFQADFADIFHVRGTHAGRRGRALGASIEETSVVLAYDGCDGARRRTRVHFAPHPRALLANEAFFYVALPPHGKALFDVIVSCEQDRQAASLSLPANAAGVLGYETAESRVAEELAAARRQACIIETSDTRFNDWINRALADLFMMTTALPTGPYPYAGVPWFSTPFGRDGVITALECLWLNPSLAHGVLAYLAHTQATEVNAAQDAEPGKILHEARGGEMAAIGEVPFRRYYGSVDATPLFVWLAGEYYRRTADDAFIASIWPNIERALNWIDVYGDRDGDGFVEYLRTSPNGLVQQGWKDSHDSVSHADGSLAQGPIALCEVQGYVYAARRAAAELAEALGHLSRARELRDRAAHLRERFQQAFWCDEQRTFALALDGQKNPCRVRTSNPGHCLWTGIADWDRGRYCGTALLDDDLFTGWGIRTLAQGEARYNPMAYHNGSVWPHDNAIAAAGLARYGLRAEALRVLDALFDVSRAVDLQRLPELFCGFRRRSGEGPTRYPVACAPQAWAAGAIFLLLQACLGLRVQASPAEITFDSPVLPAYLRELGIKNLHIGKARVDLQLRQQNGEVRLQVMSREGDVEVRLRHAP